MQLLSHPLTPEELQSFILNPLAVHMEYSVSLLSLRVCFLQASSYFPTTIRTQSIPSNMVTMAEVPPGAEEKNRFKDVLPSKILLIKERSLAAI